MNKLSRRAFLLRGSAAAGVAGAVAAMPGLPALLAAGSPEAATSAEAVAPEASALLPEEMAGAEPLVAHVRDLSTGAMDLYIGDQQVSYTNPRIAAQLLRATR